MRDKLRSTLSQHLGIILQMSRCKFLSLNFTFMMCHFAQSTFACNLPEYEAELLFGHYLLSRYIEERSFRRFVEACLEETIVVYVDHLLTQVYNQNHLILFLRFEWWPCTSYFTAVLLFQYMRVMGGEISENCLSHCEHFCMEDQLLICSALNCISFVALRVFDLFMTVEELHQGRNH